MKKVMILCVAILSVTDYVSAKEIHVNKSGNDNQAGTATAPYLTISKAASVATAGDIVIIHEGMYEESITPSNSGANGNPIIFKGASGEKVVVSAMQALSGWTQDVGSIYKTQVTWDLGQENFVLHNQTAMDLARWPNNTDADVYTMNSLRNTGGSASTVADNAYLDYSSGIPAGDWSKGGSVHFYGDKLGSGWTTWRAFIKSNTGSRVTFDLKKNPDWIRTFHAPGDKGEFFLQGAKVALDYQNEWYFDTDTKTLYVQLPNGVKPSDGAIKMRRRTQAFNLVNKNYIEIQDLAIIGGSIDIKGTGNRLYQVSSFYGNYKLAVVTGFSSGAQSVKIEGTNNTIEKSEIAYGSGNGIYDSGTGTKILNSYIHHFNSVGNYDAVINARGGQNSTYKNNILSHAGRDVIQAFNDNSEYAYNDISFSNLVADDCALIYTVGGPSNSIIHHNWFHDAYSHGDKYKAAGIYLDNDASNWDVHHNVVWNTEWTNVQINWSGTNINIYNNTLVKGKATMGAWHKDGTAFSNVNVWNNITDKEGDNAGGQEDETTWEIQSDKQNNLVDQNSFLDYANNDYHLKAGAKAIDYGRVITGVTDGFVGATPDVGAYEYGGTDWVPGVSWNLKSGPTGTGCYDLPGEDCDGPVVLENKIEFVNLASSVMASQSIPVTVKYTSLSNLELVVVISKPDGTWLGNVKQNVSIGSSQLNLNVSIVTMPEAMDNYKISCDLRPVGGDWDAALANQQSTFDITNRFFLSEIAEIPGIVEAENYDNGGEGIAYHDLTDGNSGVVYRNDNVDIETTQDTHGDYNLGWLAKDEWLEYSVNVTSGGIYDLKVRAAAGVSTALVKIELGTKVLAEALSIPSINSDYHSYSDVMVNDLELPAGESILKITIVEPGLNINYLEFVGQDITNNLARFSAVISNSSIFRQALLPGNTMNFSHSSNWDINVYNLKGENIISQKLKSADSFEVPSDLSYNVVIVVAKEVK